jgi:hypothetical protein
MGMKAMSRPLLASLIILVGSATGPGWSGVTCSLDERDPGAAMQVWRTHLGLQTRD